MPNQMVTSGQRPDFDIDKIRADFPIFVAAGQWVH